MKTIKIIPIFSRSIALSVGAAALLLAAQSAKSELVAWWDFDQPPVNGSTLDQRAGQRALLLGGAVLTPDGEGRTGAPGDTAARFGTGPQRLSSVGDYFTAAFADNTGTVSLWIKQAEIRNSTAISFVAPSVIGTRGWQAHMPWSDGNAYFDTGGCCDGTMRIAAPSGIFTDTWFHVALVRGPNLPLEDPDRTNKWLYINGTLIASGTNDAPIAVDFTELVIGNAPNTTETVNGDIDDVAVFSRPLSPAEVAQLAAGDSPETLAIAPTDSDGDGLPDLWEQIYFPGDLTKLGASPADFDLDGLSDAEEFLGGTNPNAADTDNDGLADGVETGTGIWVSASDTGTNPFLPDTDGDGLLDGVETNTGTFVNAANTGTNPHLTDTDGDLVDDRTEVIYGSNPNNPASTPVQPGVPTLLAWWEFDDDSDPAIATDTRAGIVADMLNGASYTFDGGGRSGQPGDRALAISTPGAVARAARANWLNIGTRNDRLTVMFWQRNDTNPDASSFWMFSPSPGGGGRGMQAHVPWSDGNIYYDHSGCCAGGQRIASSPAIDWTQWHHFTFVKDGGRKEIYIDGVLFLEQAAGAASFPADFDTLFIGRDADASSINGQIDDFAVFGSGLGAQDILDVATGAKTPLDLATSEDADDDGIADSWEYLFFPGDLTKLGAAPADYDNDGSLDEEEVVRNTDPTNPDSDGDGLLDGVETNTGIWVSASDTGTNPLDPDSDNDSLSDSAENNSGVFVSVANPGTNPNLADTDGDGFGDAIEGPYGSDPNDAASVPFAVGSSFLLAYWDFDDASDPATAIDSVFGHVGAVTSTYSAPGEGSSSSGSDRAMCFTAGQAVIADASFVNLASPGDKLTLSFWQKLNSTPASSSFWIRSPSSPGTERGFQAHVPWTDGNIYFDHSGCCDGGITRISGPLGVDTTQWHHYAFVKDGALKSVYVDGVLTLTGASAVPLVSDFTSLIIGRDTGVASIDGCIDEFAVFAGALDTEQIARLAGGESPDTILGSQVPFQITEFDYNPGTSEFTVTWTSKPNRTYSLFFSPDLTDFGADISDSIPSGGTTTTFGPFTLPFPLGDQIYFRAAENP